MKGVSQQSSKNDQWINQLIDQFEIKPTKSRMKKYKETLNIIQLDTDVTDAIQSIFLNSLRGKLFSLFYRQSYICS